MPDDTTPGPVDLRSDGTVRLKLDDGKTVRLKRPTMGQYRALREALEDVNDETSDLLVAMQVTSADLDRRISVLNLRLVGGDGLRTRRTQLLDGDGDNPDELAMIDEAIEAGRLDDPGPLTDARSEQRKVTREWRDRTDQLRLAWVREAVSTLAQDGTLPDDEADLPAWLAAPDITQALIDHWRSVPLGPGSPAPR